MLSDFQVDRCLHPCLDSAFPAQSCPAPPPPPPTPPTSSPVCDMALGTSPCVLACLHRPHLHPLPLDIQDPALVAPQSDPAVVPLDYNFQPGYPDSTHAFTIPPSSASSASPTIASSVSDSSYMDPTSQDDTIIAQPFSSSLPESTGSPSNEGDSTPASSGAQTPDVDPQILEALRSKDRIYVLKLGETFETLIMERRRVFFPPWFAPIALPSLGGDRPPAAKCCVLLN
jgi:hypothetical protein